MKALLRDFSARLRGLSPVTRLVINLAYLTVVAVVDYTTPSRLVLTGFYLAGAAFAGWSGGRRQAALISGLTAAVIVVHDWGLARTSPQTWIAVWNISNRLVVVAMAGLLTAELTRLTRDLGRLVEERTSQWRAEAEQHKATSESLRVFLDAVPEPAFLLDLQGRILVSNRALARGLGRGAEALTGQSAFDLIPPEVAKSRRENFDEVVRTGKPMRYEDVRGGKHFINFESPVLDAEGRVSRVAILALDITEHRRLERHILDISDREQARIGQDLHDGLCQQLVSLAFDANSLEQQLTEKHRPEAPTARRIADLLDDAITEARQLSRGLFPIRLESDGLPSALEELARSTRERFDVECRFETDGKAAIADRGIATHVYRIAREAVTNAIKHGRPQHIQIRLRVAGGHAELQVEDDGVGVKPDAPPKPQSMGLHIMDYRARSIGGTLQVIPGARGGTAVTFRLALEGQKTGAPA